MAVFHKPVTGNNVILGAAVVATGGLPASYASGVPQYANLSSTTLSTVLDARYIAGPSGWSE